MKSLLQSFCCSAKGLESWTLEDADFINELEIQIFKFLQVLKLKTVMITDIKIPYLIENVKPIWEKTQIILRIIWLQNDFANKQIS